MAWLVSGHPVGLRRVSLAHVLVGEPASTSPEHAL